MNAKTKAGQMRERRHVKAARIIYAQAQAAFPRYSHRFSPKKFTLPQLATCVLLSFYFKMSYRDFEELLLMSQELRDALELTAVPDYSTLNRMYHRFRASHLDKMNEALLRALDNGGLVQEDAITLDSTGFRPTNASAYFQTRRGKRFKRRLKGAYAVGVSSQMRCMASGRATTRRTCPRSSGAQGGMANVRKAVIQFGWHWPTAALTVPPSAHVTSSHRFGAVVV
ncbi:MAG: hypothetical protein KatS3mg052_2139 [Candidatus Roseilinea sp.]|nr:MAG: hypothetical protein KatS3mg052_2139 [Candidatus Roseilinea sp.]